MDILLLLGAYLLVPVTHTVWNAQYWCTGVLL